MGISSRAILFGDVKYAEIAAVLKERFQDVENVDIRIRDRDEGCAELVFLEPNEEHRTPQNASHRTLFVWEPGRIHDNEEIYDGTRTYLSFGGWGSDEEILRALTETFGGYYDLRDKDKWQFVAKPDNDYSALTPEDRLRINLAKSLPIEQATLLSKLASNMENVESLIEHFQTYKDEVLEASVLNDLKMM